MATLTNRYQWKGNMLQSSDLVATGTPMSKQKGFIAVVLVIFIVIIAMLGVAAAYLLTVGGSSNRNTAASFQALYLADSAIQRAMRQLLHPSLSGLNARVGCVSYAMVDSNTFAPMGEFSAAQNGSLNDSASSSTLAAAITSSSTTINVVNGSNYAPYGRIIIDHEFIDYAGLNGNQFVGVQRGRDNTVATAHAVGAPISQYQCNVLAKGAVPNFSSAIGRNELNAGIQLQEAWAVGQRINTSTAMLWHWNKPSEILWNNANVSVASAQDLNAIHVLNYAYAWAVGNKTGGNMFALLWNGANWTRIIPSPAVNLTLNTVYCNAFNDCWALGESGREVAYYNGSTWTKGTSASMPNAVMNSVYCTASNNCWAVGNGRNFSRYLGGGVTAWTTFNNPNSIPNVNYRGVWCNAANDCWAVGDNSGGRDVFVHWNGSAWSRDGSDPTPSVDLNALTCNASDDCWAAGDASGANSVLTHWDGTAWTNSTVNTSGENLLGISCFNKDDCWAVGTDSVRVHWDGSNWTVITAGITANPNLLGVSVVGAYQQPISYWRTS